MWTRLWWWLERLTRPMGWEVRQERQELRERLERVRHLVHDHLRHGSHLKRRFLKALEGK